METEVFRMNSDTDFIGSTLSTSPDKKSFDNIPEAPRMKILLEEEKKPDYPLNSDSTP